MKIHKTVAYHQAHNNLYVKTCALEFLSSNISEISNSEGRMYAETMDEIKFLISWLVREMKLQV